jgi:hypothetical protein
MMGENNKRETPADDPAELLFRQLMHLKNYEKPETARMTRNKQNIMREVRKAQASKRMNLGDVLEMNMPWFFAEPKYGIAALFLAFVGLQYAGIHSRTSYQSTGIYSTANDLAAYAKKPETVSTNYYPRLPSNLPLFESPDGDATVLPAGFKYRE